MAILQVGATRQFKLIGQAVGAAQANDEIEIDAGVYIDDIINIGAPLTLRGVGGKAHVTATQAPHNGKALLVVGAHAVIENMEFSKCAVPDRNGAAIRHEGGNLTLDRVFIHHCEMGILSGADRNSTMYILNSEIGYCGTDGTAHNLYVNHLGKLVLHNSYFHDCSVGHQVKSRALETIITRCRIQDEEGTASYCLDLPHGGAVAINDTTFHQGKLSQNPAMISYGAEGNIHPQSSMTIQDCIAINDLAGGKFLANHTTAPVMVLQLRTWGLTEAQLRAVGESIMNDVDALSARPVLNEARVSGHMAVGSIKGDMRIVHIPKEGRTLVFIG